MAFSGGGTTSEEGFVPRSPTGPGVSLLPSLQYLAQVAPRVSVSSLGHGLWHPHSHDTYRCGLWVFVYLPAFFPTRPGATSAGPLGAGL